MKETILFSVLIPMCMFSACSQDSEPIYSCDTSVNTWVKENLSEIRTMNRQDWLSLELNKRRSAYRAFTQQQKIDFWLEKLKEVKTLEWSDDELQHITKVEKFINAHHDLFANIQLTDEQQNELDRFFYTWLEEGKQKYNWTDSIGIAIAANGESVNCTRSGGIDDGGYNPIEVDCNCSTKSDFCLNVGLCEETNCTYLSDGCGWLWRSPCNGRCGGF